MIGLGANADDAGKQLERLTRSILENLGYSNLAVNVVTSGGQEIDVTADYTIPVPGKPQTRRLIAECKAYQNPVAMIDWLKFLGKVFVEETRLNQEITGLFVALSGVNGNVQGNYDEIRQHRSNISLLTGEELLAELQSAYHLAPRPQIIERLHSLTARQYLHVEPAYYNQAVYWIFTFPDSEYAILRGSGELPSEAEITMLSPLIENRLSVTSYVDLSAEAQAQEQLCQIKKAVVAKIAAVGGALRREQLPMLPHADRTLLDRSLRELASFYWCTTSDDEVAFSHRYKWCIIGIRSS